MGGGVVKPSCRAPAIGAGEDSLVGLRRQRSAQRLLDIIVDLVPSAVRHALEGVGRNLQDHIDTWTKQRSLTNHTYGLSLGTLHANAMHVAKWFAARRGMFTSNTGEAGGFVKSHPDLDRPDLQLFYCTTMASAQASDSFWGHGWAMHGCLLRPKSIGYVGLKSADPHDQPLIAPNVFDAQEDMDILVRGVRICAR